MICRAVQKQTVLNLTEEKSSLDPLFNTLAALKKMSVFCQIYHIFTVYCYTCGFCKCSPLPLKSPAVPRLSFDMCSVGPAIAA